eukprot:SAG31_NODE_35049_length_326_cov_1.814978_1_plen_26_part_10
MTEKWEFGVILTDVLKETGSMEYSMT